MILRIMTTVTVIKQTEDEDEFEAWLQISREDLLEEILDFICDSGYNYRVLE